jgi:prepilin-type N-terminal cleavage/methylation domain-containing protein
MLKTFDRYQQRDQAGFTLIEIAVVLVIVGLLVGGFIGTFTSRIETTRRDNTKKQIEEIRAAILGFASAQGRLPCPTTTTGAGLSQPPAGGVCNLQHGFVPARTLGINGTFNQDNLLVDTWGNPIRYSVTAANTSAFTKPIGVGNGGIQDTGMGALLPDLVVCDAFSTSGVSCTGGPDTLIDNAVFVILSLGKDGSDFVTNTAPNSDQGENAGEAAVAVNAAGENVAYLVGGNQVFVSRNYSSVDSAAGQFDDLIIWGSPYVLYSRMIDAGQLP